MKRVREFLSRPAVTAVLLVLALVLLGGSTLGGARAALTIQSDYYNSHAEVYDLGVALQESNNGSTWREVSGSKALMKNLLGSDTKLKVGKKYTEMLRVVNKPRGNDPIEEYVRVSVYKYWIDELGRKFPEMDSDWIELEFLTGNGWTIDRGSTTEERTVLYYGSILESGQSTAPFLRSITINEAALRKVTKTQNTVGNVTTITWTYDYNGKRFCLDVYVDGVQTHNAADAKISAWGVNK